MALVDRLLAGISFVVPAHNEAGNVGRAVAALLAAAPAAHVEALVVDDGSTDGTAAEAEAAGARVIRHATNRGYGAAVRTGLEAARQPWTCLVDADNQFDAAEISRLAARSDHADLVTGVRTRRAEGLRRAGAARAWRFVAEAMLGRLATDIDCAFKLMRTDVVQAIPLQSQGATLSAELLAKLRRRGATIVEVPVSHYPRTVGRSSGLRLSVIARAFRELWAVRAAVRSEEGRPVPPRPPSG